MTVLLALTLTFVLLSLAPNDDLVHSDDARDTAAAREHLTAALGLDRPILSRFFSYATGALHGDLGVSLRYGRPVTQLVAAAIGPSLLLGGSAVVIAFGCGLLLGTRAAVRPGGIASVLVRRVLPLLDAPPPFWLGMIGVLVFSAALGWLPASHLSDPAAPGLALRDVLVHLVLPALTLGLPGIAPVARHQALALEATLNAPHTKAARALGIAPRRVLRRALLLSMRPVFALLGLALPGLVGGAAVVEVLFSWPGLGRLQQEALLGRDVPLALGALLVVTVLVVLGGLLTDLLSAALDPRLRSTR